MTAADTAPMDEWATQWWAATRHRQLLIQRCASCGLAQHYPRPICTACGRTDGLHWQQAAGTGTVDAFTVVHRAASADISAPYALARVRLAEGPMLLTHLIGMPLDDITVGAAVTLAWRVLPDGRHLPVFTVGIGCEV